MVGNPGEWSWYVGEQGSMSLWEFARRRLPKIGGIFVLLRDRRPRLFSRTATTSLITLNPQLARPCLAAMTRVRFSDREAARMRALFDAIEPPAPT